MIQSWRLLAAVAVVCMTAGVGTATAQTVLARHVPAGEQVEVMVNGKPVGSAPADAAGDARVPFSLRDALGKTEIDANLYVDHCETKYRVWIVEVGAPLPAEGTCNLRSVSGLYWVRDVSTIVINDVTATAPSLLLLKGDYTPPAPGEEATPSEPRELPKGLVLFGGGGYTQTTDAVVVSCGDVPGCSGSEGGLGFAAGAEYRFTRIVSVELTYLKPSAVTAAGAEPTFRFDSDQRAHVFGVAGKLGVPFGIAKLYGRGGAVYNQAKIVTNQTQDPRTVTVEGKPFTIPGGSQTNELKTDGWGWQFGGGLEVWFSRSVGFYAEVDYASLKGSDVDGGEAKIDNKVGSAILGLRVHIGG